MDEVMIDILTKLEEKTKIENNPFSEIPIDRLKEALTLLEEYSEEITFKVD